MIKYPDKEATITQVQYQSGQYRRIEFGSHSPVKWEQFNSQEMSWEVITGEEKDELEDKYLDTDMSGIAIG